MKKFLSAILLIAFFLTIVTPCFAVDIPGNVDAILIERGYPEDAVSRLAYDQKMMLYQDSHWYYAGSTSIGYSENQNNTGPQRTAQLSVADLTLYFDLYYNVYEGTLEQIFVQFYYIWNNIPFCRFQDSIAISWDETKFRLKDDGFYKADKYSGFFVYENEVTWMYDEIHSLETGYANASPSGVSWYADLKGNVGVTVTELYGYGYFFLVPAHGVTVYEGDTSTLYAHYVHPTVSLGASIAVSSYGVFDISSLGGYKERGTQISFRIEDMSDE